MKKKNSLTSIVGIGLCLLMLSFALAGEAFATEWLEVCFNYGCHTREWVQILDSDLTMVEEHLRHTSSAEDERARLGEAVALLYGAAARTTPIWKDRAGNYPNDPDESGKMDCIDHAHNITAFLRMMESHQLLQFHQSRPEVRRMRFFDEHWAGQIAENATGLEFAVDAWFFDFGHPAVVIPMDRWRWGRDPHP